MDLKTLSPESEFLSWEISELAEHFHVSCQDTKSGMVGSGLAQNRSTAKKKAFAELNERYLVSQIGQNSKLKSIWALDFDSSCSGFAVGFEKDTAALRSICEGVERWALSKWIDEHFAIEEFSNFNPTQIQRKIESFFSNLTHYKAIFPVLIDNQLLNVNVAVTLGWTENGVFAGYGSKTSFNEALDHAHIEALRNFLIYKNQRVRDHFPYNRISFFAQNKNIAQEAISGERSANWPTPKLKVLRTEKFGEFWLARAVFEGWSPWQNGSESRFLY